MPCYRFRFAPPPLPLYYFGHGLPAPIVKVILEYGYEMTVWEDMCKLHDKLDDTLKFLRGFKDEMAEHLKPYEIIRDDSRVSAAIRTASARLCHVATVNLCTALNPNPRKRTPSAIYRTIYAPADRTVGFVLPEMRNYV